MWRKRELSTAEEDNISTIIPEIEDNRMYFIINNKVIKEPKLKATIPSMAEEHNLVPRLEDLH